MNTPDNKSLFELHPKRVDIVILIIASIVLLVIGLNLPVLTTNKLWESNTYSILTGIENLWKQKFEILAVIIFVFSIIFPIAKLMTLLAVWFLRLKDDQRKMLIWFMEIFGKWSMLDVFVSAIIVVWTKLGALASARIENGLYYFGASVLLTMIVSSLQRPLAEGA